MVELLVSISIMGILGVAANYLIIATLHTDHMLLDADRQVSDMELTERRMLHNLRTGSNLTLNGSTGFSLTSQSDPSNNGQTYTITYTYNAGTKTLTEASTQYGNPAPINVIAYNVTAFSVTQVTATPLVVLVDMTISGSTTAPPTRRTFQVYNRNS